MLAFLFICVSAEAKTLSIDDYVARLEQLHASIATNQLQVAKAAAAELTGSEIVSPHGTFHADDSLISTIAQTKNVDRMLLTRIELTIAELRGSADAPAPDPKLLQQVAAEQDVPELARGGELTAPPIPQVPLMERVVRSLVRMFRWIGKKIAQFLDWIAEFFPRMRPEDPGATSGMRWIVISVVTVIVLGILFLAIEVIRRARRNDAKTLASSAPLRSARDDDPLSRGATEWERYAAQLAAEGRYREAIRAWYHAVLVTCYGAGVLHFRKGRTNWEYIASLPASVAWRSELIRLTQRFEQEWYGAEQSSEDALDDCSTRAKFILETLHERGAA
ncbi:MAG: DUF4129 domain-containing protein [Thermoanaerobaculia bacterium]